NKADRPGADRTVRSLKMMLHLGPVGGTRKSGRISPTNGAETNSEGWNIPVLETIATEEKGMAELVATLGQHMAHLRQSGEWLQRERDRSWREIELLLQYRFMRQLQAQVPQELRERLLTAVAERVVDPYTAVNQLLSKSTENP
ncbi:MAG: hypothetical protein R3D55_16670, partial [Chloroflexota bacterium]